MAKDIKDAIPKLRAERIFVRAESQISCATLSAIIVSLAKTNDIRVGIHHDVFMYFYVSLFLQTDVMKGIFLLYFFKGKKFKKIQIQSTTE